MFNKITPRTASLLLSEPFMLDPNFRRSVVLLCEHTDEGTVGYVLNQSAVLQLGVVVPVLPEATFPLFIGGPVAHDSLHFIHKCPDRLPGGADLGNGLHWGGNMETLTILAKNNQIAHDEIKFLLVYSGWRPGHQDRYITKTTTAATTEYPSITVFNSG